MEEWRGFDLTKRKRNILRAFNKQEIRKPEEFPIIVNTPCYFGFGNSDRPKEYWESPQVMIAFQEEAFESHLSKVDDDTIPYFMPWFGTGVLASAFGSDVIMASGKGDDPAIQGIIINEIKDIAGLKKIDPYNDGLMPKVLEFMEYAKTHSDLPIGLTDMNSPLSTATQLCGYENLFIWMYEEPEAVKDLLTIITESLIDWVKLQKEIIGEPLDSSNGLQGVWSPKGTGIWLSDDDIVSVGSKQYGEFIVPQYSKIFSAFGGGSLHFCGSGLHQADNILSIKDIKAVNNSPMGNFDVFGKFANKVGRGKLTIQIQDIAPEDIEGYYTKLFEKIDDLRGIMLATFVLDKVASNNTGGAVSVKRDPIGAANDIVRVVRKCVENKISNLSRSN